MAPGANAISQPARTPASAPASWRTRAPTARQAAAPARSDTTIPATATSWPARAAAARTTSGYRGKKAMSELAWDTDVGYPWAATWR